MRFHLLIILATFLSANLSSCNRVQEIDYRECLEGEWRLKNAGDLQRYFMDSKTFVLKDATLKFNSDGTIATKLKKADGSDWLPTESGTWDMPKEAGSILIKSDKGPFNDRLTIEFGDERTFYITSNDIVFHFIKIR